MSMKLAKKPYINGYARIAYNVFTDMDNAWLSRDEVFDLLPNAAKADKQAKRKLTNALTNGVERGLFVYIGESRGNKTDKKFRVATADHQKLMLKKYYAKEVKRPSKTPKKAQPRFTDAPKSQKANGTLLSTIDSEIERVEARLADLNRMREIALTL